MSKLEKINYPLIKKAWAVKMHQFDEGYLASGYYFAAESKGKAKAELLRQILSDGWILKSTGEQPTYLNLPIDRAPWQDVYNFEGNEMTYWQIREVIKDRKRMKIYDDMLKDEFAKYCYIRKGGYYYRPNANGYTEHRAYAGVYILEDAVQYARSCSDLSLIPIDIEAHNAMINEKIADLQTRFILPD
jgi:hypothetical protein